VRQDEFERLYAEQARPLFAFPAYRTGDRALAEDLAADAFERALRSRRRYDPRKSKAKTWLYAIALNCLRDHQRRTEAAERALERSRSRAAGTGGGEMQRVDDRATLSQALGALSGEEREAVALRYGADLTVPEVARILGEPLQRVEGRVYRALRKLREELERTEVRPL
jgi:RNA polymerase sigma factor (sigma-70 family)